MSSSEKRSPGSSFQMPRPSSHSAEMGMGPRLAHGLAGAAVLLLALAAGAAAGEPSELARGSELLAPFKRDLQEALRRGLAEGPDAAVAACRLRAPEIAKAHSGPDVRIGRTSHRLRNPANVAPPWVGPVLERYLADASDRAPRAVAVEEGRRGYVEPILVQPPCLMCHGTSLAPEVAARIDALYPEDRAVGFEAGELRGVFWVEFPAVK